MIPAHITVNINPIPRLNVLVCSEVNLTLVSRHTWWIDSGATTHISVSMQDCLSCRRPTDVERYIYVGGGKGKQTNMRRYEANRAMDVFELIHADICGPFSSTAWNGQQYFITLIDDFFRYGYIYLIHEKSQSLDVFKSFKVEVENQLGKSIKKRQMVVNTTTDMMVHENNVQDYLLNS
ncbi:UNVERIFIED_CONTAM: hypothetical protein Scaly_1039800 [Sesamum calycinum]|uniref:Integrase catalytic domain-containing protein n=1 Tax=Sesamum calycinum TaxID=2727403 RepID=A0AAW2QK75_9LAMI